MRYSRRINNSVRGAFKFVLLITLFYIIPTCLYAYTPIARWDVVPYQRIEAGDTYNLGIIAFSKAHINRVEINISGQGYSGPRTQTLTSMTYNSRTNVYEYWFALAGSYFSGSGLFSVDAIVYGEDGDSRTLDTLFLNTNGGGGLSKLEAWVSLTGSDGTGIVSNSSYPFRTIAGAINAIQAINGGKSDGGIIYLNEGTHSFSGAIANTSTEWLTITKAAGASKSGTIIDTGIPSLNHLKVDGLTLKSKGFNQRILTESAVNLWVNDCDIIGSGRWVALSNPIEHGSLYCTNSYIYDCDRGFAQVSMVRGTTLEKLGNDAFANSQFLVNVTVNNIHNGTTGWHSDAYQVHTTGVPPAENRIIYNFRGTDLHISGLFARSDAGPSVNNAFVNVFFEMREPFSVNESNTPVFDTWDMYHIWDHLLIWHCTLPISNTSFPDQAINSSFIGNVMRQYIDYTTDQGNPVVANAEPSNSSNNEFLYNHIMHIWGVTPSASPSAYDIAQGAPLPHWYAAMPDSSPSGSVTTGASVVDLSDPSSETFGAPLVGSVLIDRIPFATIPADINGNPRDSKPDVGAFEGGSQPNETSSELKRIRLKSQ